MKKIWFLAILISGFFLFSLTLVSAQELTNITKNWGGKEYTIKALPEDLDEIREIANEVLNKAKEGIISLGISENYFNRHFRPLYIFTGEYPGANKIQTVWDYAINEYKFEFQANLDKKDSNITVRNDEMGIIVYNFLEPTKIVFTHSGVSALKEMGQTISTEEAKKKIKECPSNYRNSAFYSMITKEGSLFLIADGPGGISKVNLETGNYACEKSVAEPEGDITPEGGGKISFFQKIINLFKKILVKFGFSTGYCNNSENCKKQKLKVNVECLGGWTCENNQCRFVCSSGSESIK